MLVTEEVVEAIQVIGDKRAPDEACGIVFADNRVLEVENESSLDHTCNFHFGDLRSVIRQIRAAGITGFMFDGAYLIWHTHPAGSVGPSLEDLRARVKGVDYLVVALTENGPVAVRY